MDYNNLIFLHIPKAAGSTLHPVLERHYSKRSYRTISVPEQLEAFKQSPEAERRASACSRATCHLACTPISKAAAA